VKRVRLLESINFDTEEFDNCLNVYVDGERRYAVWGRVIHHVYTSCSLNGPPLDIDQLVCPCGHEIPLEIYFLLKLRALEYGA